MKNYNWFMGIDVSKEKLDVTILKGIEEHQHYQMENSVKGIKKFIVGLKESNSFNLDDCLICMEHTGIYNAHLLTVAQAQGWHLCLEAAIQIKQSGGLQRGKNDIIDSLRIALYAYKNAAFVKLWQPAREVLIQLKKLSGVRERLINAKKQLKTALNEGKSFEDKQTQKLMEDCCAKSIAALEKDIEKTEAAIDKVIAEDQELKRLFTIVRSVPGIGTVTALQIIVTTNEFKQISNVRKYACYAGVAPFEHTSGSSIRGKTRTSKKANMQVKTLLHMASLVASVHCQEIREYYQRKVSEGKNKMSVLNAVKNKLLYRIFACVNQNRCYEKKYRETFA
jgi:transposase